VLEGDDTLHACPPARPRFSVQDRVPYGVDRGVERVQSGEMVLVTVGFAHAVTSGSGREKSLGKRYVGFNADHVDGLDLAISHRKALHSEGKQGVLRQPHLVAMHAGAARQSG